MSPKTQKAYFIIILSCVLISLALWQKSSPPKRLQSQANHDFSGILTPLTRDRTRYRPHQSQDVQQGYALILFLLEQGLADAPESYDYYFTQSAQDYGIDPLLLKAICWQESRFNPKAQSKVGAIGLMQLMPETAKDLKVEDPWDPQQNIRGGAQYISQQLAQFQSVELALAAYNAGPGSVVQYQGVPPYPETQNYVQQVLNYYYAAQETEQRRK